MAQNLAQKDYAKCIQALTEVKAETTKLATAGTRNIQMLQTTNSVDVSFMCACMCMCV